MAKRILICHLLIFFLFCFCGMMGCKVKKNTPRDGDYVDAVELKLKFRELADQLLATMPNHAIQGYVAMPASFVDQNNTSRSSALGRLIAESMFFEFNQRGYPSREYRLTGNIDVQGSRDNLALVPSKAILSKQCWAAILLGTYCVDDDATFINARLVRGSDGLVLRTAQLVLVNTPIIYRLGKSDRYFAGQLRYDPLNGLYVPTAPPGDGVIPIRQSR
ncbi:MAG: hypothetical protein IJT59_01045 [Desulfovibrionaceae bacterium]|nr:hypothetical protein [Desulfovibrionaceae bacterium]